MAENHSGIELFVVTLFLMIVVAKQVPFTIMGDYTDRYYFMIMPLIYLFLFFIGKKLFYNKKRMKQLGVLCLIGFSIWNVFGNTSFYTFPSEAMGEKIKNCDMQKDYIVVLADDTQWKMTNFTYLLKDADRVFFTTTKELEKNKGKLEEGAREKYLIVWSGAANPKDMERFLDTVKPFSDSDNQVTKKIKKLGTASTIECIGKQFVMNDWFLLYNMKR